MKVMVETSARHVHVSEADLKTLFGADAKLTVKKELSQPGQYASNEKVEVILLCPSLARRARRRRLKLH